MPRSPLPPRDGISATSLRAPGGRATHAKNHLPVPDTIGDWLREEFPAAPVDDIERLLAQSGAEAGRLCDITGRPVAWDDPVEPGGFYFFHRPVPPEARIPFEISVVCEDEDLLVVDKPHFLASTPNGRFVRESVVTRARQDFDQPDLVAIHRLDRVTAGLLILSKRPETRGRYQRLFQDRKVTKTYRALAPLPPENLDFPLLRESRLIKPPGGRQVREVEGEPNAISRIRLLGTVEPPRRGETTSDAIAEYELEPLTGKTHQLRVHMNALGLPILGDPVYPIDREPDPYDFDSPLQLLAAAIEFDDPLTGRPRRFDTALRLDPGRFHPRSAGTR